MRIDGRQRNPEEVFRELTELLHRVDEAVVTVILGTREEAELIDCLVRREGYCTAGVEEYRGGFRVDVVKGYSCSLGS